MAGSQQFIIEGSSIEDAPSTELDLVSWILSIDYDEDKPILVDAHCPTRFVTKRRARHIINSLASTFKPNSTVCLHLANDVLYPVLLLSILASGGRWTGTNVAYTVSELEHHFRLSNTQYVITADEDLATVCQAAEASGGKAEIILFSDLLAADDAASQSQAYIYRTLHGCQIANDSTRQQVSMVPSGCIAALMQTSGTTGKPKLAMRSHRGLMLEMAAREDNHSAKPYEVSRLICTPIFHGFTLPVALDAMRLGICTYVMRRFTSTDFASSIHRFNITETFAVPIMLLKLVRDVQTHASLQSLRLIAFGGTPLVPELRRQALSMFDIAPRIVPVYGLTEGGWLTTAKYPEDAGDSIGRPIPGVEMKIDIKYVAGSREGEVGGELLIRGEQITEGYFGNEVESEATFDCAGWFRTGDHVTIESDGQIYFTDRDKSIIKVNGFQVSPTELEGTLAQCDDVVDAAVIGVGRAVDEHPIVCVVPKHEGVTEASIKAFLRSRLSGYKVSKCRVAFMNSIMRSSTGKVVRSRIEEQVTTARLHVSCTKSL